MMRGDIWSEPASGGVRSAAVMAGFIVWLARRRLPLAERSNVHREVGQFLGWRDTEGGDSSAGIDSEVRAYLEHWRRRDATDAELRSAAVALERLVAYVHGRSSVGMASSA